jgi:DNA-binding transcriptional MerR regulator
MRIGEAAKAAGISERMLRYYEQVSLLPAPARRTSGYRDYSTADVEAMQFIRRARALDFPMDDIAHLLALWRNGAPATPEIRDLARRRAEELHARAGELEAMQKTLEALAEACPADGVQRCSILDALGERRPTSLEAGPFRSANAQPSDTVP